jgi:2,3-bisphosphoglycerate-independent phosphoglycerate mutase
MLKPVVLLILDGWGIGPPGPGNAISLAKLKNIPRFWISYPHTKLVASGEGVGLPSGEDGNTETGHINIGAGRVVYQDLPRINMSISDRSFYQNHAFIGAHEYAKQHNSNVHLMGLLSDSGVHASRDHLYALLEFFQKQKTDRKVYLHLFTDGRDSPPNAGLRFVHEIEAKCKSLGVGEIATIMGRYYGMDRDRRWERTQTAYVALTEIIDRKAASATAAVEESYKRSETDEFVKPTIIMDSTGKPLPRIQNHDSVIFYNYRIDRPRQLTRAFVLSDFETKMPSMSFDPYAVNYYHKHVVDDNDQRNKPFDRKIILSDLYFVTMTEYERSLPCIVAYPPQPVKMSLGRVYAENGLRQLRVAETEKERFVGYYFNGVREDPFVGEDRLIVPSPKVATYDLKPEMSVYELTQKLLDRISLGVYSLFVVNFANADMVGHTGNIPAAIKACEIVDECVGKIVGNVLSLFGTCILTADHGNVEEMLGPDGEIDTEHSTYPVPFVIIDHEFDNYPAVLPAGKLCDIAPTILSFKQIPCPGEMTGRNLLTDIVIKRR